MLSLSRCGIAGGAADFDRGDPGFDAGLERGAGVPPSGTVLGPALPSLAAVADGGAVAMLGGEGGRGEARARWRPQIHVREEGVVAGGVLRWTRCRRRRVEWGRGLDGDRGVGGDGGGRGFGNVESSRFRRDLRCMAHGPWPRGQSPWSAEVRDGPIKDGHCAQWLGGTAYFCSSGSMVPPRGIVYLLASPLALPAWLAGPSQTTKGPSSRTPGANEGSSPPPEMISDGLPVA